MLAMPLGHFRMNLHGVFNLKFEIPIGVEGSVLVGVFSILQIEAVFLIETLPTPLQQFNNYKIPHICISAIFNKKIDTAVLYFH